MTPLDLIERGIILSKWEDVIEGYKLLTGKELRPNYSFDSPPPSNIAITASPPLSYPTNYAEELQALQVTTELERTPVPELGRKNDMSEFVTSTKQSEQKTQGNQKKPPKIESVKLGPRPNLFNDDLSLHREDLKAENEVLQKLYTDKFVERRKGVAKVNVTCSKCGRNEMVSPILAPISFENEQSEYFCNNCIGKNERLSY